MPNTPLKNVIADLYTVFGKYPQPSAMEYCTCGCTEPEALKALLAKPLGQLDFNDIADYSFSAMTTQGSTQDFKYFLPRLFEGICFEEYRYNPEVLFGKLDYAKWKTWNDEEISVLRRYFLALWDTAIDAFPLNEELPAFFEIETVIASLASSGESLEAYLRIWSARNSQQADLHLLQLVTWHGMDIAKGNAFETGFWEARREQACELRTWLTSADILDRIQAAAPLLPTDGFEHLLAPSLERLDLLRH